MSDGLLGWGYKEGFFPQIAESWNEVSSGTVVFKLKTVLDYSGKVFACTDVAALLERTKNEKGPFRYIFEKIKNLRCITANKLEIVSLLSTRELLSFLASPQAKIIRFSNNQIISGVGPFFLDVSKDSIVLRKNIFYYNNASIHMEEIKLVVMDDASAVGRFLTGDIDLVLLSNLDSLLSNKMNKEEVASVHLWSTWGIAFNQKIKPVNDKNLRLCLIEHSKSEDWVKQFYPNNLPAYGAIPLGLIGNTGTRQNVSFSMKTKSNEFLKVFIPKELENSEKVSNWIKMNFSNCIEENKIQIEVTSFDKMLELFDKRKMAAYLMSFNKESISDGLYYRSFYSDGVENFYNNHSAETRRRFEQLFGVSKENLKTLSRDISKSLASDGIMVPLMHPVHQVLIKKCLSGIILNPINEGYFSIRGIENKCL